MYVINLSLVMKKIEVPQSKGNTEMGTDRKIIFMGFHIITEMEIFQ
jgi:hypothetical protein